MFCGGGVSKKGLGRGRIWEEGLESREMRVGACDFQVWMVLTS